MRQQGYWADLKAPDFTTLDPDTVAILPLGATEQHGPHLPLSVDTTLTEAVLARSLPLWPAEVSALILPTLTVTKSNEHLNHPGTLTYSARTLLAMLDDIAASVARTPVRRLLMINGHGGNTAVLEVACREIRIAHGLITAHASWFAFTDTKGLLTPEDEKHDIHAGDLETSAMLAAAPDLVDMTRAPNTPPKSRGWTAAGLTGQPARPGWIIDDVSDTGVCGDATAATAEKGAHLLDTAARSFAAYLPEFAAFDPQK